MGRNEGRGMGRAGQGRKGGGGAGGCWARLMGRMRKVREEG